jgi:hypothetical protein
MPSTLRAFVTLAGCAAVTAATLAVSAAPVAAGAPASLNYAPSSARVGASVTITDSQGVNSTDIVTFSPDVAAAATVASPNSLRVTVPAGAKTGPITVNQAGTPVVGPTFTVDPTPAPQAHTRLAISVSKAAVTYPGKVGVTATLTASGRAVKGLGVRLEHRTRGTSAWHHVSGTLTEPTSSAGVVRWSVTPKARGSFRAVSTATKRFAAAASHSGKVGVRPAVHLSVPSHGDVLLTETAKGKVSPSLSGRLLLERRTNHRWHVIAKPRVRHGLFSAKVHLSAPGKERFRVVRAKDTRHLGGTSRSVATEVSAPTLRLGSSSPVVTALQRRLRALHYDIGSRDGNYGWDAEHAVTAFQKVQGMSKDGVAGPAVFAALAHPKRLHLHHVVKHGIAVEVNIDKQVLLISKNGKIWRILDTSTAGGYLFTGSNGETERAVTPRGHFHIVYKVDSLVHARLGTLNRPSFFNFDGYAIHGEGNGNDGGEVPPFPNSHGCVRITDNAVNRYYSLFAVGMSVWIY